MSLTSNILMIRPLQFTYNAETAETNAFQHSIDPENSQEVREKAMKEFDEFVAKLRNERIHVHVFDDTPDPVKPDAVFPNNWISTHEDGSLALYPMCHDNRRTERREDIVETLQEKFSVSRVEDFSYFEVSKQFMEGTGSVVIDRENKIMYACLSPRTDLEALETIAIKLGYKSIHFKAVDQNDQEIYHTNVMMSMGDFFVVICMDSIRDTAEKDVLLNSFADNGKQVIQISYEQMNKMAGNMILLKNERGQKIEVMSEQAFHSLTDYQMTQLMMHAKLVYSDLSTIEKYGGGSARCMIAELFLPEKRTQ